MKKLLLLIAVLTISCNVFADDDVQNVNEGALDCITEDGYFTLQISENIILTVEGIEITITPEIADKMDYFAIEQFSLLVSLIQITGNKAGDILYNKLGKLYLEDLIKHYPELIKEAANEEGDMD